MKKMVHKFNIFEEDEETFDEDDCDCDCDCEDE
jgi:hypothetical protein